MDLAQQTGEKVDSSTIMQRLMGQAKLVSEKNCSLCL